MLLRGNKHGTSLPQCPEISGTDIFNTEIVKQKHGPLCEHGKGKPEQGERRRIVLRSL